LGALVGVTRLPASKAVAAATFTLVDGHGGVTIPAGLRVATTDGQAVFQLQSSIDVLAGINTATGTLEAQDAGAGANGIAAGFISQILDPQPYLSAVASTETSAGGAETETDEAMRERIKLAPASYSTAGSREAYVFHASTASAAIIDVEVQTPAPGFVDIYPLVLGGATPTPILEAVEAAVNDEKIRPLTDTVTVISPAQVAYDLEVALVLYEDAIEAATEAAATAALQAYADAKARGLGQDVVLSQIVAAASVAGVYSASVVLPAADVVVGTSQVAALGTLTVTVTGTNPG
jgi:phage-related baseplate assembly protein